MNQPLVVVNNGEAKTTSLAIAEGMEMEHASVIKLVRTYQADLQEFGTFGFEIQKTAGRPTEYAMLNQEQATLIMTYMKNTEIARLFKIRLVKAFYELAKSKPVDTLAALNDPATMRTLLLSYSEKVMEQDEKIAILAPKAEAHDRIALADGSVCITDAAKILQMRPADLFGRLSGLRWIYRRTGGAGWIAYQDKIQQGLLEHKVTTVARGDGSEKITEQVRVTPKGLTKLAGMQEATA